jgi:hypothetical protein
MRINQKKVFDAGVDSTTRIPNTVAYLEHAQVEIATPRSHYAITESISLPITNRIVGINSKNINIADGERRPGHKA